MGYLDGDGFLHVIGRKKNAIDLGNGQKIFPEELETVLCRSSYIKECVVVGYPDKGGKPPRVVALIYPDVDALRETYGSDVSAAQIENALERVLAEVNGALPSYKRIETFLIRNNEFPKTSTKKIRRAGLAEMSLREFQGRK
jgi:long-chain acyl-CoA synthetase